MFGETRKLQLISAIIAMEDESVLDALERIISNSKGPAATSAIGGDAGGSWSAGDVDEMNRMIEEGFM